MAGAEVLTCGDDGNRMRCACVDIGTNTTRLLVAEREGGRLREVVAVRRFLRLARDHGARDVRAVATAAIRSASNRHELCRAVQRVAGVEVEVLSGEAEA